MRQIDILLDTALNESIYPYLEKLNQKTKQTFNIHIKAWLNGDESTQRLFSINGLTPPKAIGEITIHIQTMAEMRGFLLEASADITNLNLEKTGLCFDLQGQFIPHDEHYHFEKFEFNQYTK